MKKRKRFMALVLAAMLAVGALPTAGASDAGQSNVLSASGSHTGLITADGSLWMWGWNEYGQVGDGTTEDRSTPVKVMDDVATVSLTYNHSAAIKKDGSLWMWGSDPLGDGTTKNRSTPVKVMDDVAAVSLGSYHFAAIKKDGSLWTWGRNGSGQVGDGTTQIRSTPVKVMDDVAEISLRDNYSAALKKDGSLWTWGYNRYGQVGDGTTQDRSTPVKVMDNVATVSLRGAHSAALKKDGSLWMWGRNDTGQLGDGTTEDRSTPVKVMDNVAEVSLGIYHSAAIKKDGSLWMWGSGPLGDSTTFERSTPFKVMDDVATVSLIYNHSAVIKKDGSLWMWGGNWRGELGDGTTEHRSTPFKVMDNVAVVSLGDSHSVAVKQDSSVWIWGSNRYGQLGMGEEFGNTYVEGEDTYICQTIPVRLNGLTANMAAMAASTSQYTVTLNLGGGTGATSMKSEKQALLTPPTNPSRDGYFFAGWFKDSALTQPWNFDKDKVTGNLTLYAKWQPKTTATVIAEPSTQSVLIDGKEVNVPTYILRDGNNYAVNFVKLRDVAYLLDGTAAQFNVDWRNNAIRLDARAPYTTKNGAEMTVPSVIKAPTKTSITPVLTGGVTAPLESFLLTDKNGGGHNYFKLRDIGKVAGFAVQWDSARNCIIVNTTEPYAA